MTRTVRQREIERGPETDRSLSDRLKMYADRYWAYVWALRENACVETVSHYEQVARDLRRASEMLRP